IRPNVRQGKRPAVYQSLRCRLRKRSYPAERGPQNRRRTGQGQNRRRPAVTRAPAPGDPGCD
ncbi:hypothetical protein QUF75_18575, partial [Desulfococcaceae bacterium HSG7]|nr:hypothetical protein [Desulfococcaceae bacterium HSG7]